MLQMNITAQMLSTEGESQTMQLTLWRTTY